MDVHTVAMKLQRLSVAGQGALVLVVGVVGFGMQMYVGTDTCVKQLEDYDGGDSKIAKNFGALIVLSIIGFLLELVKWKQGDIQEDRRNPPPSFLNLWPLPETEADKSKRKALHAMATAAAARPGGGKAPPAYRENLGMDFLTLGFNLLSSGLTVTVWVLFILTNTGVHDAIDDAAAGTDICGSDQNLDMRDILKFGQVVVIVQIGIWVLHSVSFVMDRLNQQRDGTNSAYYQDNLPIKVMNIRVGGLLRMGAAIGLLFMAVQTLDNNFDPEKICRDVGLYSNAYQVALLTSGVFVWVLFGCDNLVGTSPKKVASFAVSRTLSGVLLMVTLFYYLAERNSTEAQFDCNVVGTGTDAKSSYDDITNKPYHQFLIGLVIMSLEIFFNVLISFSDTTNYTGGLGLGDAHGVYPNTTITGRGLKPSSKDMSTLRLTTDGPDKKASSTLQFV